MDWNKLAPALQAFLAALCGLMVTMGVMDQQHADQIISLTMTLAGAAVGLVTALWMVFHNSTAKKIVASGQIPANLQLHAARAAPVAPTVFGPDRAAQAASMGLTVEQLDELDKFIVEKLKGKTA